MGFLVLYQIFRAMDLFLTIVSYVLLAYCVLSWFVQPGNRLFLLLHRMVDPILEPFRALTRRLSARGFPFDVSVILALFAIRLLSRLLWWLFQVIAY